MGQGYSGAYRGTTGADSEPSDQPSSIDENARRMSSQFHVSRNGYFGRKDHGRIRVIESADPLATARAFFAQISKGGNQAIFPNAKGVIVHQSILSDGSRIVFREITKTPNSPAVEISISGPSIVKEQKVHFIKEKTLW